MARCMSSSQVIRTRRALCAQVPAAITATMPASANSQRARFIGTPPKVRKQKPLTRSDAAGDQHIRNYTVQHPPALSKPPPIDGAQGLSKCQRLGDAIHAGDIELGEGIKLATNPETLVLTCHLVAAAKSTEELEEEMPTAPEVITEKAAEEGAEEKSE